MGTRQGKVWQVDTETFKLLMLESRTWSEALRRLGLPPIGGNHYSLKARVREEGLDVSHFKEGLREALRRGGANRQRIPLDQILVEGAADNTPLLKKRLVAAGLLKNECALCQQPPEWKGRSLVLILDHKNGKRTDGRLENLRLLCPNCNSQTDTFCGRNKPDQHPKQCPCGALITPGSKTGHCSTCANRKSAGLRQRPTKIAWPDDQTLLAQAQTKGFLRAGKDLGVSDNAIRKRLRQHGVSW